MTSISEEQEREAFEAHLKTAAWHQVMVQAKDEDDDGASIFRMCRMAAREAWIAGRAALAAPSPQQSSGGEAQSDLPPPDSAYWVNHDVTSPYTERAKPVDTPYNLGWMSGWAAHGRAYPEQAAPAPVSTHTWMNAPKKAPFSCLRCPPAAMQRSGRE